MKQNVQNDDKSCIFGLGSVSAGYLFQGTTAIKDFGDKNLPALTVLLKYLSQLEVISCFNFPEY